MPPTDPKDPKPPTTKAEPATGTKNVFGQPAAPPEGDAARPAAPKAVAKGRSANPSVDHHNRIQQLEARERERQAVRFAVEEHLTTTEIAERMGVARMTVSRWLARAAARDTEGADVYRDTLRRQLLKRQKRLDVLLAASSIKLMRHEDACAECQQRVEAFRLPRHEVMRTVELAKSRIDQRMSAMFGLDAPIQIKFEVEKEVEQIIERLEKALDKLTFEKVLSVLLPETGQAQAAAAASRREPN